MCHLLPAQDRGDDWFALPQNLQGRYSNLFCILTEACTHASTEDGGWEQNVGLFPTTSEDRYARTGNGGQAPKDPMVTSSLLMKWGAYSIILTFPDGIVVKNLPANSGDSRDTDLIPRSGRSPGVENGNLLQYSPLLWIEPVGHSPCGHQWMVRYIWARRHTHIHSTISLDFNCKIQIHR